MWIAIEQRFVWGTLLWYHTENPVKTKLGEIVNFPCFLLRCSIFSVLISDSATEAV